MPYPGLSSQKAAELLEKFGPNELKETRKIQPLKIFFSQFTSPLVILLLAAAAVSFGVKETLDAAFILLIVILNALFGFIQEYRAEKAIAALKKLVVERVRVIRDGVEREVDSKELVPGDVFIVDEGQKIPADGKLLEAFNMEANEASLTGESIPVGKNVGGKKDEGSIFMGTAVEKGSGLAQVTQTGMNTRFGKVASLLSEIKEEPTPLQKHLESLGKILVAGSVGAVFLVIIFGVWHAQEFITMLLTGISLAVAVVPEGLPAIVTITLALGVLRMARRKAIIRKLNSIEAIGSVDVICSDKTGTLTKNEMQVRRVWYAGADGGRDYDVEVIKAQGISGVFKKILEIGVLCSTTSLEHKDGEIKVLGDRTEGSLLSLAENKWLDVGELRSQGKRINSFAFDATLKRMSVVWQFPDGRTEVLTKGAPERLLEISKVTEEEKRNIMKGVDALAAQGYRLLGFGYKEINPKGSQPKADPPLAEKTKTLRVSEREDAERDLTFLGFVAIADPPRGEVKEAIGLARGAGIEVVMITGDNPLTARAIAEEVDLVPKGSQAPAVIGPELDKADDEKLAKIVKEVRIFARVSPEHKLRIVKAFQALGKTVAVTGDGVNDAPALKQAHVGLAMGIIGTDVAKEAAQMVVADDNFASIVSAVEEGRVIYENILKSIRYLLSCNAGELIAILGAVAIGLPSPLTPVQILWMNLVTDGLPALALAEDPEVKGVMRRPPRRKDIPIIEVLGKKFLAGVGIFLGIITLISFDWIFVHSNLAQARTVAFSLLVVGEMLVAFLVRKGEKWNSNQLLLWAITLAIVFQLLILFVPPLQRIFDTVSLF